MSIIMGWHLCPHGFVQAWDVIADPGEQPLDIPACPSCSPNRLVPPPHDAFILHPDDEPAAADAAPDTADGL